MKKIYTEEQRNEILQRYRTGEKVSSICEDTGIAKSTLYAWTKSNNKKKRKEKQSNKHVGLSDTATTLRNIGKDGRGIAVIPLSG